MTKITLVGFGNWGKALLKILVVSGNKEISIYTRQNSLEKTLEEIVGLDHKITFTNDLDEALNGHSLVVIAKKSQEVDVFLDDLSGRKLKACLQTSKGLSSKGQFFSDLFPHYLEGPFAVLFGPTFASDLLASKPSIATLGSKDPEFFISYLNNKILHLEISSDIKGLELSSLLKNIFSIASGIVTATYNSDNSKAAFITKAFNELLFLLNYFGYSSETAHTAAALGDLILTSYSSNSRNYSFGKAFIYGLTEAKGTVEGLKALEILNPLLPSEAIICKALFSFLKGYQDLPTFLHQVFGI
jgi:glycerol-3-phosphate dehydrogenase (NAD(P)+)